MMSYWYSLKTARNGLYRANDHVFCDFIVTFVESHLRRYRARKPAILFAAGFDGGDGGEVGGKSVGREGFDVEGEEAEGGDAEIDGAVGAVHGHGDADDFTVVRADDVDGFLDAAALGDDILDDEDFFAGGDFKAAAEDEFAVIFFDEDESGFELAGDFLAEDKSAHGGGDYGDGGEGTDFGGEGGAEFLDGGHLLEGEGALEKAAAVESAAQDEMAVEQGAGVAEDLEDFVFGHGRDVRNNVKRWEAGFSGHECRKRSADAEVPGACGFYGVRVWL